MGGNYMDNYSGKNKLKAMSGLSMAIILMILTVVSIGMLVLGICSANGETFMGVIIYRNMGLVITASIILMVVIIMMLSGFKVVNPNEALVLTLFGKYYGTISKEGFYYVNPFCVSNNPAKKTTINWEAATKGNSATGVDWGTKKVSLKATTLNNEKQKVNDLDGNPIEIGVIVIWKVVEPAKAVFNVDNYITYVSTQCDSAIRQVARSYPYDMSEDDEKSLRGSSQEIAEVLKQELQTRTEIAGIEIMEARISHLAYAPEIAAAMLQRQQASAIIAARQKIVEGAVGMVEMALNSLSEKNVVELDDERKAQMVSNLLVVLCGNKDAQPIVNSGSIY